MYRLTLGDFELTAISDGTYHLDGGAFFGVVPKVMWERRVKADEKNLVPSGLNSVVVRTGEKTVLIESGELVLQLDTTKLVTDCSLELAIPSGSTAVVDGKDGVTTARQELMKKAGRADPIIAHHLACGTAICVDDQRNLGIGRNIRRQKQFAVENGSIVGFEIQEPGGDEAKIHDAARIPDFLAGIADAANGHARWGKDGRKAVDVMFPVVSERSLVATLFVRNQLKSGSVDFH